MEVDSPKTEGIRVAPGLPRRNGSETMKRGEFGKAGLVGWLGA